MTPTCTLKLDYDELIIDELFASVRRAGGTIAGDQTEGSFQIPNPLGASIEGTYSKDSNLLLIDVLKRPDLLTCDALAKAINRMTQRSVTVVGGTDTTDDRGTKKPAPTTTHSALTGNGLPPLAKRIIGYGMIGIGLSAIVGGIIYVVRNRRRK